MNGGIQIIFAQSIIVTHKMETKGNGWVKIRYINNIRHAEWPPFSLFVSVCTVISLIYELCFYPCSRKLLCDCAFEYLFGSHIGQRQLKLITYYIRWNLCGERANEHWLFIALNNQNLLSLGGCCCCQPIE